MRLLAGLKVTRADLTGMGVGGLLMEIVTRPQPRTVPISKTTATWPPSCSPPDVHPDGGPNKLLAEIAGKKLVRISDRAKRWPRKHRSDVVTGHQATWSSRRSRAGLKFVRNPDFAAALPVRSRPASPRARQC